MLMEVEGSGQKEDVKSFVLSRDKTIHTFRTNEEEKAR